LPERAFSKEGKMGLKENLERSRLEFANQEKLKKDIEQQRIEACRRKALILHEKSSELLKPYIALIKSSDCINVLKELVSLEKLKDTEIDIKMMISNNKKENKYNSDRLPYEMVYKSLNLDDGFLTFYKRPTELKEIEDIVKINPNYLEVKSCGIELEWNIWYEEYDVRMYGESVGSEKIKRYTSVPITFKPDSIEVFNFGCHGDNFILKKENINKESMGKIITDGYISSIESHKRTHKNN
jgi:hypothetical protein